MDGEKLSAGQVLNELNQMVIGENEDFQLSDLINVSAIQSLMDDFYKITNVGVAILDLAGNIMVATGWQDICTKFHRIHPVTANYCIESDTALIENIKHGEFRRYKCRNNMWDIVTPIVVGGKHLGNLFLGQFLFQDEEPDLDLFREQARKYGFDESSYIEALQRVPRWTMEQIQDFMNFYTKLTTIISSLGHKNLQLIKTISERDDILDDLRKSRAMFSGILNSVPQSIFWKDKNGVYLGCNEHFARTTGLKAPGEIIGKTDFDLPWPEHEAEAYRKDDAEVIASNRIKAHIVEQLQQFDGSRLWIDTTKLPLTDSAGNAIGVLGVYEDVTEQISAREELIKMTDRHKMALDASNAGTWDWDISGNVFYWSEEFLKIFGMEPDTVLGFDTWTRALHPDDVEVTSKKIMEAIEDHQELLIDYRVILPTGEIRWIRAKGYALYQDTKPVRMVGLCIDITSQKQIELSLLESEKKFSKAFQFSPIILAISTLDEGKFIEVNEEFSRSTGYSRDEVIGRTSVGLNILKAPDRKRLVEEMKKAGQCAGLELDLNTKEGRTITCIVNIQEIELEGKPHLLSTFLDITSRKQMEKDLKNEMMRLELLNSHMVNRELRMIELKKENAGLKERLIQNPKPDDRFEK